MFCFSGYCLLFSVYYLVPTYSPTYRPCLLLTYLPTYPAYLPACLPAAYLPTDPAYLFSCLSTYIHSLRTLQLQCLLDIDIMNHEL